MPTIKRYPNRKLYDTEAKQYITLEGIADLIRQGKEIQVIDNASGEDLTALTLTQIILEFEKKQNGFLPRNVLAGIIQASGDRLISLQKSLLASVGFVQQLDDEIRSRIYALVSQGEISELEGKRLLNKLLKSTPLTTEAPSISQDEIVHILDAREIPTHSDFQKLLEQIDQISVKIESLSE